MITLTDPFPDLSIPTSELEAIKKALEGSNDVS